MPEGCGALAGEPLAEIALGIADAQDRAAVVAHLESCPACRDELRAMTEVADGLLELVPPAEPPVGFEERVLAVTQPAPRTVRRRWPRLVAAAAVVAVALAGGWALAGRLSSPAPAGNGAVETAALRAGNRTVGQVVLVEHAHPWMSLRLDAGPHDVTVRCQVVGNDGRKVTVGTFWVADGRGYWAATLPADLSVSKAQLLLPGGRVLAAATILPG